MKDIRVSVVDSIADALAELHTLVRMRAYERFLTRGLQPGREMDDWLEAERELLTIAVPELSQENQQTIAKIAVPSGHPKAVSIKVTSTNALVRAETSDSRLVFAVIQFPKQVRPEGIRAAFSNNMIKLISPILDETVQSLEKSA
jgi:hypothetical protein